MKKWLVVILVVAAAVIGWGLLRKSKPPQAPFVRARRQKLVGTLPTNGKVEPLEWQAVRAETAALVVRVPVDEGARVAKGAVLAQTSDPTLEAGFESAQARVAEARAALNALEQGGRPAEVAEIDNSLARARFDLATGTKEYQALGRLEQKQAATRLEVQTAADKVQALELEIRGLETRRASLVAATDVEGARARLAGAEAALALARTRQALSVLHSPLGGVVYQLAVRPGAYLNPGDLVADVGRLDRVRVRVYVDEPLLGRVAKGQPVIITWEALPGKRWEGRVEQMPTAIQTLGTRQVGEVVCTIENPGGELLPGVNVDAEIRTEMADDAIVIPKEALHHDATGDWVFLLRGDIVEHRPVKTGIGTVTTIQILDGIREGDQVATPGDATLEPGQRVTPIPAPSVAWSKACMRPPFGRTFHMTNIDVKEYFDQALFLQTPAINAHRACHWRFSRANRTAWMWLHKLRYGMAKPGRDLQNG
ncbi:MAG: efflux RND transporter periplasmic adaptor subunit [Bryobacteraceae bacterium]|jgi:HlyD family secretion protein